jgi:hypothetical protein
MLSETDVATMGVAELPPVDTIRPSCAASGHRDLATSVVAAIRRPPHIGNVLTHISRSNWDAVDIALRLIFNAATAPEDLTPLARNIVDLMCGDRGTTGRIMKPYFHELLSLLLAPDQTACLTAHIAHLYDDAGALPGEGRRHARELVRSAAFGGRR